jgi:hypothetical protein
VSRLAMVPAVVGEWLEGLCIQPRAASFAYRREFILRHPPLQTPHKLS